MCFFKQKAAYEVRISDWSSDVCSSDLGPDLRERPGPGVAAGGRRTGGPKRDVLDSSGDDHLDRTGPTGETEGGRRRSRAGDGGRRRPDTGRGILCHQGESSGGGAGRRPAGPIHGVPILDEVVGPARRREATGTPKPLIGGA